MWEFWQCVGTKGIVETCQRVDDWPQDRQTFEPKSQPNVCLGHGVGHCKIFWDIFAKLKLIWDGAIRIQSPALCFWQFDRPLHIYGVVFKGVISVIQCFLGNDTSLCWFCFDLRSCLYMTQIFWYQHILSRESALHINSQQCGIRLAARFSYQNGNRQGYTHRCPQAFEEVACVHTHMPQRQCFDMATDSESDSESDDEVCIQTTIRSQI